MSYQQSERERREEDLVTATEVSTSLLEKGPHIHGPRTAHTSFPISLMAHT